MMNKYACVVLTLGILLTACDKVEDASGDTQGNTNQIVHQTTDKLMAVFKGEKPQESRVLAVSPTLEAQDLMRAVYKKQRFSVTVNSNQAEEFGLEGAFITGVILDDVRYVSVFRELMKYTTPNGQERYLVLFERINLDAENNWEFPMTGHVSTAGLDFAVFTTLPEGGFGLVKKHTIAEASGSYGRAALFYQNDKLSPLVRVGKDTMGLIYHSGYTSSGVTEGYDRIVLVNDHNIQDVAIAQTYYSNEDSGMFGPSASYTGKVIRVDESNADDDYYPIVIRFTGTNIPEDGSTGVVSMNKTLVYQYDGKGEEYHALK